MRWEEKSKRIYFLVPAPIGISPGQRFRFEHYLSYVQKEGMQYKISSFYTSKGWASLYKQGSLMVKAFAVLTGYGRRCIDLFRLRNYGYVYIYREAAPLGPPLFEWIIAKLLRKKIVYDFDDAIWVPVVSDANKIIRGIKCFYKIKSICKWAAVISVGNSFLASFAAKYNANVRIIPTVVDTENAHNTMKPLAATQQVPVVGWTGTHSTLKYLQIVLPALKTIQQKINFAFIVIADIDPQLTIEQYRFIKWNKETEIEDLLKMDIGLMPLTDDELSKGKCGFKAIQYMALGIPPVVSPVGVNKDIVEDGVNGYTCITATDWVAKIQLLLADSAARTKMGAVAKKLIEEKFSVKATQHLFMQLFTHHS